MKKSLLAVCMAALMLLPACGGSAAPEEDTLRVLATTYPVYLFTTAVTGGAEGVEVSLLVNAQTSCLHDYTLTVTDMKAIEGADVIVMNGVGLEDFMADALAASDAQVIDASAGVELLESMGHEGHDHDAEYDPHIWMDPANAAAMMGEIATQLTTLTGEDFHGSLVTAKDKLALATQAWEPLLADLAGKPFITFHDGFQYFAAATGLNLLKAIEEEEGAEASAADIKEIVELIKAYRIPAIFTEKNGSDATAMAIARELGETLTVSQLDMLMSGTALEERQGIQAYIDLMEQNMQIVAEALK